MPEIIAKRRNAGKSKIGFGAEVQGPKEADSSYYKYVMAADLITFGLIPEFVGRIPKRLGIEPLTVDQLERILTETDKSLVSQKRRMLATTTELLFTRGALRAIAEEAQTMGTNGRALRDIVEEVIDPIVFNEPKAAVITAELVRNRKAEIDALNSKDAALPALSESPFVIDDDQAEETLAKILSPDTDGRPGNAGSRRTGRELVVTSR